ncbi:hypothetical protein BVRB_017060, partial [Beta vulgaris subsp. vulgaris]
AINRGHRERVTETIGILKRQALAGVERITIVDKAVIVGESPEHGWIDEPSGAEPPAADVNVSNAATIYTGIQYLNCVSWDSAG